MFNKSILAVALAGCLVAVPFLSQADGGFRHGGKHHRGGNGVEHVERMAMRYDFTAEQRDAARAIADKYRPKMREMADRSRENSRALHELRKQDVMDQAKLKTLADAQGDIVADKLVLSTMMRAEFKNVLTEEQRARWKERGHGGKRHGQTSVPAKS